MDDPFDRALAAYRDPDWGHVRWFGASWGAPVCDPAHHTDTPTGEPCGACACLIVAADHGVSLAGGGYPERVPYHLTCVLQALGLADKKNPT